MNKFKSCFSIIAFAICIFSITIMFILTPPNEVSATERRTLSQMPELTVKNLFSGDYFEDLENYFLDQIPFREGFRSINSFVRINVFNQSDVNDLWVQNGSIFKHTESYKGDQVKYGINVINGVSDRYLKNANVYYSIIPEKNYFVKTLKSGFNYNLLEKTLNDSLNGEYIDIFDTLSLDDYYKTDSHWSQDKIFDTAEKIGEAMGVLDLMTPRENYEEKTLEPFYGVYYGQASLDAKPDKIKYLESEFTKNAKVYGISPKILKEDFGVESKLSDRVYAPEKLTGIDGYDVFLSGAEPVVIIENSNAKSDKELVIFRDSFGSSIAPLFTGAYKKITLVDLRYIPSAMLGEYVDIDNCDDALFLYSASMLNSSMLMR